MAGKVVRTSLVDQVYSLILEKIQNRELLPGDRLNIEELARDFGVSRTPVRETINRLTQEGFIEQKHNVGPSIIQLSDEQAQELIDANAALFNLVFDSYRKLENLDCLTEELQKVVSAQITACERGDERPLHEASVGFHKVLIQYCSNPIIRDYTMKTQNRINMCTFAYMAAKENRQESIAAHSAVSEALRAGDIEKARALMEAHNRFAGTEYFKEI